MALSFLFPLRLLCGLAFLCLLGVVDPITSASAMSFTLEDLGYPAKFSDEDKHEFMTQSRVFLAQRAQEPFVHFFRDANVYGRKNEKLGVLVEIVETAEVYDERRWRRRREAGLVSPRHPRLPPVCGAGVEEDGEVTPRSAEDVRWREVNPTSYAPLVEIHFNFTNCISPPEIVEALTHFTRNKTLLASPGYATTEANPYEPPIPHTIAFRNAEVRIEKGLQPLVKLIPEGETWRVDVPPELFAKEKGDLRAAWPTPPNCRVRFDVRTERVFRGRTSLKRCRELITEAFGFDPYAKDAEERRKAAEAEPTGKKEAVEHENAEETVVAAPAVTAERREEVMAEEDL